MAKRLLDFNPLTGESVFMQTDNDQMRIVHEQDVTSIIDGNKRLANDPQITRDGIKNDMLLYASIPNTLIVKWKQELGLDVFNKAHRNRLFKLLNSPEYKYLKTTTLTHNESRD